MNEMIHKLSKMCVFKAYQNLFFVRNIRLPLPLLIIVPT